MQYEYKSVERKTTNLDKLLNELGEKGWELCAIYYNDIFIFKKIKSTTHYYAYENKPQMFDNESD